jgi:hypothetical protein
VHRAPGKPLGTHDLWVAGHDVDRLIRPAYVGRPVDLEHYTFDGARRRERERRAIGSRLDL